MTADKEDVQWTPWSNLALRWKGLAVIAVPLLPLVVVAGLVTFAAGRQREAQASVAHALTVKAEIATLVGLFADADTSIRGYLLTRSPEHLQAVVEASSSLLRPAQRLASSLIDTEQRQHLARLIELARQRPMTPLLEFAKTTSADARVPVELLAQSGRVMAQIRAELTAMQQREDAILETRVAVAQRAHDRLLTVSIGGVGLGIIAALVAMLGFTHGITKRIDALRGDAVRLAAGHPITASPASRDEVGQLTAALVDTSALLQRRDQELQRRVREVEGARSEIDQFFNVSLDLLCIAGFDGRFHRVNGSWQPTLGWTPEELVSAPFVSFVHPEDVAATEREAARLSAGDVTIDFENRYRCRDGTYRWLNWKSASDPQRGLIYAAARDVTFHKQWEAKQQARVAELDALNQELEAFSYSVSHDLRAPLRHIAGFATLLEKRASGSLDQQSAEYLVTIKEAAGRMGRLIDDLLAFSRLGRAPVAKRAVNVQALVDSVKTELHAELAGRDVDWRIQPLPDVSADPALLRVVLMNLIANAIKYTRTKSRSVIEIGALQEASGDTVLFVRDDGVGFDMQYAHKLFGVFQRLHGTEEFEGTGIGLATVRRIVHRHGGRTWAESALDRGATFYVSLPHTDRQAMTYEDVA